MYYHLFDLQNRQIMETGKNSESLKELKEALLSYISVDYPTKKPENPNVDELQEWEDWQTLQGWTAGEIATAWDFAIEQTHKKLNKQNPRGARF